MSFSVGDAALIRLSFFNPQRRRQLNILLIDMVLQLFKRRRTSHSYARTSSILPTKISSSRRPPVGFPKRYARIAFLAVAFLAGVVFFYGFERIEALFGYHRRPPLYGKYHEYEERLPQHNLDLPYPEGRDAKYFWASNHVDSACVWLLSGNSQLSSAIDSGWGNAMQELLLNAHLAYVAKRT